MHSVKKTQKFKLKWKKWETSVKKVTNLWKKVKKKQQKDTNLWKKKCQKGEKKGKKSQTSEKI